MKIENQICTLEQAKKLKELGVQQDGLFTWCVVCPDPTGEKGYYHPFYCDDNSPVAINSEAIASAFTVAELGSFMLGYEMPFYWKMWEEYCFKENGQPRGYGNEAEARAAKLIHLIKSNMLTIGRNDEPSVARDDSQSTET